MLIVLLLLFAAVEVDAHGTATGKSKTRWEKTGCCGDSRTGWEKTVEEEYNYVNPNPGIREQAPGKHWHTTITFPCVNRHHWGYDDNCDTERYSCEDEWVLSSTPFKTCKKARSLWDLERLACHYNASNKYKYWDRDCTSDPSVCKYYRYVEEEVCKDRLVP